MNGSSAAREPEISVVISVKNRSVLLRDCLDGLGAQSLPKAMFEVVVIDNCSTENLALVVDAVRASHGLAIRLARTEADHGPAPARNLGVNLARGSIIAFTDSDCRPSPDWLAAGVAAFASAPDLELVTGPILPKPGQTMGLTSKMSFNTTEHPTFPTANAFYRRATFLGHGGFDVQLSFHDPLDRATECADTDLAWRIIKQGGNRRFVTDAVMYHVIEDQKLHLWLLEGTRLFVLPELVRRHPELRASLLHLGVFFYPQSWLIYLAIIAVLAAAVWQPLLLLAVPVVLLVQAVRRTRTLRPGPLALFCARFVLVVPRMAVMTLSLLYGSARFHCLVL